MNIKISNWLAKVFRALGASAVAGLLLAFGCLLFFWWIAGEVLRGETQNFDDSARTQVHELASPALTAVMHGASFVGSTVILTVLGIGFVVWFYLADWKRAIMVFLMTNAGAAVLLNTLKFSFARPRPQPYFDTILPTSFSFPSGHAMFAICFFGILAYLIHARYNRRAAQIAAWTIAIPLIFLIGFSRIYLGVHYPSDVIAGFAAGFVWLVAVALGDFWLKLRRAEQRRSA